MSLLALLRKSVGNKVAAVCASLPDPDALPHQDEALPLGGKIGALVDLSPMPFLRLTASILPVPKKGLRKVVAISRIKYQSGPKVPCYRFYLDTGDESDSKECFIQVYGTPDKIISVRYYVSLVRFIPQSAEEQRMYTGVDGVGLGSYVYSLSPEQLAGVGIADSVIQTVLDKGDGTLYEALGYYRAIEPDSSIDFVPPCKGAETRLDDAEGVNGLSQDVWDMTYERVAGGGSEFLQIALERVKSHDGHSDEDIHVDIMAGIEIGADGIKFVG